ncbi:hypothetical protein V5799_004955 [Amblyomma americanum]|uniref:Peptidase M13 C-terminal domain-containing protein n=1 Tax=Amblyomma americanum TaxID=6943 RepID=A0AAQ4D4M3_AMBAM
MLEPPLYTDGLSPIGADCRLLRVCSQGFRLFMRKFEEEFEHSGLKNLDLTQNQLFFISFAMTWCESVPSRLREIVNLVTSLPDPQYRVEIALAHFDKFGKYFACNDNLVIYQDKKCSII